ncbi:MAG: YigZ family protein [Bacillota bacterium]|nr:YigZ family protein [Bacillota bacterium]
MSYKTVKEQASAEYEEKKSVFIGSVCRVESEEQAREFINGVKVAHREARHNVYAYIIGRNREIQRYSDDGEPQGTGGIPVLEVIKRNELCDTIVVVTRYFGGTLLGAAGLVRAYSKAASLAVKEAGTFQKVKAVLFKFKIDYDLLGKIEYTFSKNGWQLVNTEYADKVLLSMLYESGDAERIKAGLKEMTYGKFEPISEEEGDYFKEDDTILMDVK